jgi:hypothetical protein
MSDLSVSLNGVTDLPAGKIACVVTFMQHFGPPPALPEPRAGLQLSVQMPAKIAEYRNLYRKVGANFLWLSRLLMPEAELADWLGSPTTEIRFATRNGVPIGLVELDRSVAGETEVVSFGVVPEEIGSGASHFMMQTLLAGEFATGGAAGSPSGVQRVWLHTCTFDHPAAIRFYKRHGFSAYKFAVEIAEDPRLTGQLPKDAAPQVPLLEG